MVNLGKRLSQDTEAALVEINETLRGFIAPQNVEYNRSLLKFQKRLKSLGATRLNMALNELASTFVRPSRRGKIATQPHQTRKGFLKADNVKITVERQKEDS